MVNLCQIDELGLSCMGCCGRNFGSKKGILDSIKRNTVSFKAACIPDHKGGILKKDKVEWGRRLARFVHDSGVCYNLIMDGARIFCPLHPKLNNGKDLRDNVCEKDYMCKTFFLFKERWDNDKRKAFLELIEKKVKLGKLDWFSYSKGMDSGMLLKEFRRTYRVKIFNTL